MIWGNMHPDFAPLPPVPQPSHRPPPRVGGYTRPASPPSSEPVRCPQPHLMINLETSRNPFVIWPVLYRNIVVLRALFQKPLVDPLDAQLLIFPGKRNFEEL